MHASVSHIARGFEHRTGGPPPAAARKARVAAVGACENFHVLSILLPARLRKDFANLYAFCRAADDLADESGDPGTSLALLAEWRAELRACFAGRPRHPVFVALRQTISRHDLPAEPFEHLLDAFEQDQRVSRYATWSQLLDYCRRSANPVGRLVLMVCGYRDATRMALADRTCTALQLTNFWQDVRDDYLTRRRIYVPADVAASHALDLDAFGEAITRNRFSAELDHAYRETIRDLSGRTQAYFAEGRALLPMLSPDVRGHIRLFTLGGEAILAMIANVSFGTHCKRPALGRFEKLALLVNAWAKSLEQP